MRFKDLCVVSEVSSGRGNVLIFSYIELSNHRKQIQTSEPVENTLYTLYKKDVSIFILTKVVKNKLSVTLGNRTQIHKQILFWAQIDEGSKKYSTCTYVLNTDMQPIDVSCRYLTVLKIRPKCKKFEHRKLEHKVLKNHNLNLFKNEKLHIQGHQLPPL